jgi:hypothetical protein
MLGSDTGTRCEVDERCCASRGSDAQQPLYESLCATLANFDLDYRREQERIGRSTGDPLLSRRLLQRLAERHRERCEPYLRHIAVLETRMRETART